MAIIKYAPLHSRIDRKLCDHGLTDRSSCSIFKVPNQLRQINDEAYEPQVISIGPYHHGKNHLKAMEVQKMHHLKLLLGRTEAYSVERYVRALEAMEKEARKFYSEPLDHIGRDEFVEMMLLDGSFIIELILQTTIDPIRENAYSLLTHFILRKVRRDLLLVENQLPFFILSELFSLYNCQNSDNPKGLLADAASCLFSPMRPYRMRPGTPIVARTSNQDVKHLLGLLHDIFSSEEGLSPCEPSSSEESLFGLCSAPVLEPRILNCPFICSATELNEAGIKFQKKVGKLLDIKFQKGVMSIPTLKIDDDTETILRNLVAYEQCYNGIPSKRFTAYVTFMDCLINTGKDVGFLCHCGVLYNWLGDHEVVATMFNRLRDSVLISEKDFFYSEIFTRVNRHCNRKRNQWKAKWKLWKANLWHNYFNTPWALISFIAAVFLLLCTMLQTVFSIMSYRHQ